MHPHGPLRASRLHAGVSWNNLPRRNGLRCFGRHVKTKRALVHNKCTHDWCKANGLAPVAWLFTRLQSGWTATFYVNLCVLIKKRSFPAEFLPAVRSSCVIKSNRKQPVVRLQPKCCQSPRKVSVLSAQWLDRKTLGWLNKEAVSRPAEADKGDEERYGSRPTAPRPNTLPTICPDWQLQQQQDDSVSEEKHRLQTT